MVFDVLMCGLFVAIVFVIFRKCEHKKSWLKALSLALVIALVGALIMVALPSKVTAKELLVKPFHAEYLAEIEAGKYMAVSTAADGTPWYTVYLHDGSGLLIRADNYSRVISLDNTPYKSPVLLSCYAPTNFYQSQILMKLFNIKISVIVVPQNGLMWYW